MEAKVNCPWTSHVEKTCRGHKSKGRPVDGINDTDVAGMKKDGLSPRFSSTKDRDKSQKIKQSANNCAESVFRNGYADGHSFAKNCSDKATLDKAFIEKLCSVSGNLGDEWIEYYDLLLNLLSEQAEDPKPRDCHHKDTQEHGKNGSGNVEDIRSQSHPSSQHPGSGRSTSTVTTDKLCSKCGYVKQSEDCSDSPVKNRVHFVNGACVSSLPKCACGKPARERPGRATSEGKVAEESAKPSTMSHLSSSEVEFYRNLRYYFGSGRVKNRKAPKEMGNKEESVKRSGLGQACSETHHVHENQPSYCGQKSKPTADVREKPGRHKGKEGQHKEKEDRHKEEGGQHKEKEGQHKKKEGRHNEKGGQHKEKEGRHKEEESQHKEKEGRHKEKKGQHKEKEGQHNEKEGQHKEKEGQHNEKEGQHKEKEGQHKEKEGRHKEKEGQHKEKEGQHKEKEGRHMEEEGQHKDEEGRHKEKEGQHKEKEGQHKEKEGQHKAKEGQHKEKEGRQNCAHRPGASLQHDVCGESSKKVQSESWKKPQASGEEKKTFNHRCHESKAKECDDKTKTTSKSKLQAETKGEHHKHSKEDTKSKVGSQGKPQKPKHNSKSKPAHKTNKKDKPEQNKQEVDLLSEVCEWLNDSGREMMIRCSNIVKSVAIYAFILVMLVLGFVMYCIWIAGCHMCRKSLQYTGLDKWLASARAKFSEWQRPRPKPQESQQRNSGQRQGYELPKTGEEAVKHMLSNKDNDNPYSVFGLPPWASDDEIKRHYRKLAVLIHPDKNSHPQAGEAFKILANAFDILGDPEKRMKHDIKVTCTKKEEEMRNTSPFNFTTENLFAEVYRRMEEMANHLYCDACNGKHRRYKTDRSMLNARYCSRCDTRHSAKEGDLWAETKCLGFKIYFYACMEGDIYDVTDWAACQGIQRYHVEANAHTTHLKIQTRQSSRAGCSRSSSRAEDEQFEDFVRTVFGEPPSEDKKTPGTKKERKKKQKKKK